MEGDFQGYNIVVQLFLDTVKFVSVRDALSCNDMHCHDMDRVKRIWYLSPMRAAKLQVSLRIRAVPPEPSLLAHTSSESRGTFRQKARSLAPLNGWACAVKMCHDGILEDTDSLDAAYMIFSPKVKCFGLLDIHFFFLVYLYYVCLPKSHH